MTYYTYRITVAFGDIVKSVEIVACDAKAAHADIFAAYEGGRIIQTCQVR